MFGINTSAFSVRHDVAEPDRYSGTEDDGLGTEEDGLGTEEDGLASIEHGSKNRHVVQHVNNPSSMLGSSGDDEIGFQDSQNYDPTHAHQIYSQQLYHQQLYYQQLYYQQLYCHQLHAQESYNTGFKDGYTVALEQLNGSPNQEQESNEFLVNEHKFKSTLRKMRSPIKPGELREFIKRLLLNQPNKTTTTKEIYNRLKHHLAKKSINICDFRLQRLVRSSLSRFFLKASARGCWRLREDNPLKKQPGLTHNVADSSGGPSTANPNPLPRFSGVIKPVKKVSTIATSGALPAQTTSQEG